MSVISKSATDALGAAMHALRSPDSTLAPKALAHLGALGDAGHSLFIDLAASDAVGATVIIAAPPVAPDLSALTPRQRDVAWAVARGLSNKDVARALGISPATVKDHVHAILSRLNLRRRGEIAARLHPHSA